MVRLLDNLVLSIGISPDMIQKLFAPINSSSNANRATLRSKWRQRQKGSVSIEISIKVYYWPIAGVKACQLIHLQRIMGAMLNRLVILKTDNYHVEFIATNRIQGRRKSCTKTDVLFSRVESGSVWMVITIKR